jgi:uncharacterized protein YdhG (YjbR/CyaY superfamily)
MNSSHLKRKNVDEYIAVQDKTIAMRLKQMRQIIKEHTPDAVESILYGMPAYKTFGKPLVYFAAFPKHIGFYATPTGHEAFAKDLAIYKQGKGSVQFPHDKPLPIALITKIVKFRVKENKARYSA